MDPCTIATTCVGLIAAIAQLTSQITSFVSDFRDTRTDLEAVTVELHSLSMCLECLREDYSHERVTYPDNISKSLSAVLENCENVMTEIQSLLDQTASASINKRLQWAMHGREKMKALRFSLEAHKSAIDIALEMSTAVIVSSMAKVTTRIECDTKDIKQDTAKIELVLDEIYALRSQLRDRHHQEIGNHLLDKFLNETSSYAESIVDTTELNRAYDGQISEFSTSLRPVSMEIGQSVDGLQPIYSFVSSGCPSKIPLSTEEINQSERIRAKCSHQTKKSVDQELETILMRFDKESRRHVEQLELLLNQGADANLIVHNVQLPPVRIFVNRTVGVSISALALEICTNKNLAAIVLLISRGADVTHPSILQIAARIGSVQILDLLLKQGCDPNALAPKDWPDSYQGNALIMLCREDDNQHPLSLLLKAGADPNMLAYHGESALFTACFLGFYDYFNLLLAYGASVFIRGASFGSMLQHASGGLSPSLHCVEELIRRGCPVNETGGFYGTALSAAASQGYSHVVDALLQAGADPNEDGGTERNALDWIGQGNPVFGAKKISKAELDRTIHLLKLAGGRYRA